MWNGEGKFIGADGKVIKSGIWKDDKLVTKKSESEIHFPDTVKHLIMKLEAQPAPA